MLLKIQRFSLFITMMLTSIWLFASDLTAIPHLTSPVMDKAQMMSPNARQQLNTHLLEYSREKGSQIAILTVPTIEPETPFDYATRVMQSWQLGRQKENDGVLLLIVRDERKTHLAVGRGLEGAIPDIYAKRILQDVLRPYLQKGQIDEGIFATVSQIEKLIAGEQLPPNTHSSEYTEDNDISAITLIVIPLILGGFLRAIFGRTLGSLGTGAATFALALLGGFSLIIGIIAAIAAAIWTFAIGSNVWIGGGGPGGGGWSGGDNFRGGSGGFGGGGFSGGGGSFGGGGASGGW